MSAGSWKPGRICALSLAGLWLLLAIGPAARADDFAALCADRASIEHVYYQHRLGTKPPFEQIMPTSLVERLVREDARKEAVLKKAYGVEITPALLEAEVRRINTTTRAPDILAELKAALGNDTNRFARTVAKPFVVERILREKFDNDDALHAPQRKEADGIRARLLAARQAGAGLDKLPPLLQQLGSNQVSETTWQLEKRPEPSEDAGKELAEARKRFGPEAQILSPAQDAGKNRKLYFEDLPAELQQVLNVQLRQPGDVSAVIETPGGFLLYLCKERTPAMLGVEALSIPKRSYEQWMEEQGR